MEIGITEKTRKFLGLKPLPAPSEGDPFKCWDLVRADCGGRKLLVMSNASNRLSAVSTMTGADWKKLPQLIPGLVRGAIMFAEPAMSADDADAYLAMAGEVRLTKTHGRKSVGGLNEFAMVASYKDVRSDDKLQWRTMHDLSRFICHCPTRDDYVCPGKAFLEDLEARLGRPCGAQAQQGQGAEAQPARTLEPHPRSKEDEVTDIAAARMWAEIPAEERQDMLSNAWCPNCGGTSFAQGYSLRIDELGVAVFGNCAVCGTRIKSCYCF